MKLRSKVCMLFSVLALTMSGSLISANYNQANAAPAPAVDIPDTIKECNTALTDFTKKCTGAATPGKVVCVANPIKGTGTTCACQGAKPAVPSIGIKPGTGMDVCSTEINTKCEWIGVDGKCWVNGTVTNK